MNSLEPELIEVIDAIWGSTLGLTVEHVECAAPSSCLTGTVKARIDILGAKPVSVFLECSEEMARKAARSMFGIESEEVAQQDLTDAVSELVNILGGNIRSLVPTSTDIGLPVDLVDPEVVDREHGWSVDDLHCESEGMAFHVSLQELEHE